MKDLTEEILREEAKKFFPEMGASFDLGVEYSMSMVQTKVTVFPEYPEWKKTAGKTTLIAGYKSLGWGMQEAISGTLGLAYHLIENNYPTEGILAMLPRDFSQKVAERLKEQ